MAATAVVASSLVLTAGPALSGPGTYGDDFAQLDYDGSDGTIDWSATPWVEELDGGDPTVGLVQVVNDPTYCETDNCLQLTGNGSVKDRAATRRVDLAGAGFATLSYDYLRFNWWSCRVRVQSRPDAGSGWSLLATYPVSGGTDPAPISASHAIPLADISATTEVRFIVDEWCDPERFYVDNVLIDTDLVVGNSAPTDIALAPAAIDENVPLGTVVGTLTTTDPEITDTHTYALAAGIGDTHNGSFVIVGDEVRTAATLNFETLGGSLSIRVESTDSGAGNLTYEEALPIVLNDLNEPPVPDPIVDQYPDEADTVSVTATATDPDVPGDGLFWTKDSGPGAVDATGNYTWLTGEADGPGTFTVVLRVTDDGAPNLADTASFDVTVAETNQPPILVPVADQLGIENTPVAVAAAATDPDLPPNTLLYSATGLPPGVSIDSGSGLMTGTVSTGAAAGSPYTVEITVTDDGVPSRNAVDTFSWTIFTAGGGCYLLGRPSNDELSVTDLSDTNPLTNEATIGWASGSSLGAGAVQPGTGTLFATGPSKLGTINTGTGEYTAVGAVYGTEPGSAGVQGLNDVRGLAFDPTSGTLFAVARRSGGPDLLFQVDPTTGSAIPDAFGPGAGYVEIVSDDIPYQDFYGIAITAGGQLVGMANEGGIQWKIHTIDKLTGAALAGSTWSDTSDLSYDSAGNLWAISPAGVLTNVDGSEPTRNVDNFPLYVAVACAPASGPANQSPVFDQDLLDRADAEGTVISLSASATDPDLDTLLYIATGLPPGLTINPGSGLVTGTINYTAATGSPYAVEVTVTDNGTPNLAATDTFTWIITNVNQAPVGNPDAYVIAVDATLTAPPPGVLDDDYDPDGDPLVLTLDNDVNDGTLSLAPDGSFTYTPDPGFVGVDAFTYEITDPSGDSVKVDVTITVDTNAAIIGLYLSSSVVDADTFELTATPPSAPALPDYEPDGSPGLTMLAGSGDGNEADPAKFQWWDVPLTADLELLGPAAVEVFAAVSGFALDEHAHVEAWLFDCNTSGTVCSEIASQDLHRAPWDTGAPTFDMHTIELGHVDHMFSAGRILRVMLQVNKADMWLAFDTVDYPARLLIVGANQAPVISSPPDQSAAEASPFTMTVTATDPNGHPISWSENGLPAWATLTDNGDSTATISGTPGYDDAGTTSVTVLASDGTAVGTATFALTVDETNRNPSFDADLLDRTDGEGTAISLSAAATDPDLDTLLYTATGLPTGLSIDPGTGLISGTIDFTAAAGSPYAVEITVTDNGTPNLSATDTFTWTVTNTNRNPIFDADLLDRADGEAVVVSLAAGATDPDLDSLLYSATGLPTGLSIDPGTGLISGTIDFTAAAGSPYATVVTVTDNGAPNLNATDTFTWTVVNSNRGPVFDNDLLDRVSAEGVVVSLPSGATDPDLDNVLYSATGLPTGLSIDPGTGLISGTISFTASTGSPFTVEITATDSGVPNLDATDTFAWTVTNTNRNPIFDSDLLDRAGAEGAAVLLATGATDPDLDTLLYAATGLPTGLSIDPGTGSISGTISFTASTGSPFTVEITVTDNGVPNLDATDTFAWTVTNTNRNPMFDSDLPDRVDAEGAVVSLAAGASDPDFETLLYSATGLPPGLSIDPGSGLISGTISFAAAAGSPYAVEVTVADNGVPSLAATDTFTWTVTNTNRNPAFDTDLANRTDAEGAVVVIPAAATDPDLDTLSYTATGLPPGFTINPLTGLIAGTISFTAAAGSPYAVVVTVTDTGTPNLAAVDTFTWTVTDVNRSPVFDTDLVDRADGEATVVSLPAAATDPDLDTLTYSAAGLPPGLSIDPATGLISGTISFTAAAGSPYAVEITVSDDRVPNLSAIDSFGWTVVNSNRAPVFNTDLADRTDPEDTAISLSAAATDPDANTVSYSATGLPPGLAINRTTGLILGTIEFTAAAGSPYSVTVTVIDSGTPGLSAVDTFTWTVANTNRPPALDPIADIVGDEQTPISFTAIGTDPDLDELVFSLVGAPSGAVIEARSGVFTWTPTEVQGPDTYSMTVVVTDTGSPPLTNSQIIKVAVAEANRPPSLAPIVDQAQGEGGAVNLTVAGTDPDLPANTLTYRATGLPPGIVIDPVSGVVSGTIDAEAAAGSPYTVEITLTDMGAPELTAVHTFTWTVTNVDAPAGLRKKTVVDALVGFEKETTVESEARPMRRSLVLMGATASASAAALRWPLGILLVLLIGFITIGRIGLYPVLRRGDRFTGVIGFYDAELGFGLVTPDDDSKEIFIHSNAFPQRQQRSLEAGTRVRYRLFVDDNRPCAWAATTIERREANGGKSP